MTSLATDILHCRRVGARGSRPSSTPSCSSPSWRRSWRLRRLSTGRAREPSSPLSPLRGPTPSERDSSRRSRTFFSIETAVMREGGQATVEAAVMLPSLMLVLALLVQPACIYFTRVVMRSAAAEGVRVVATDYDGDLGDCKEFVLRRLRAVPDAPLFHVGGREDWTVTLSRRGGRASVEVVGHVRPLPLLGVTLSAFREHDEKGLVLRASVTEAIRPSWLRGSYGEWQRMWG